MLRSAFKAGEKNKAVPGWLRALIILPCLAGSVILMVWCGNVFDYLAEIQIDWFDGYYVVVTTLLTVLVYLFILVICLLPAVGLVRLARIFYSKK